MKELFLKFRALTNYRGKDIADLVGVSKQHISYLVTRESEDMGIGNKSALTLWMDMLTDNKIIELENNIKQLIEFKKELRENIMVEIQDKEEAEQ